jgi:hypothetical protein
LWTVAPSSARQAYDSMVPLTIACLTLAFALGLGTGAVFPTT